MSSTGIDHQQTHTEASTSPAGSDTSRWRRTVGITALTSVLFAAGFVSVASPVSAVGLVPVDLGTASTYAVLSGASVANTVTGPVTTLRGDLGVTVVNTIAGFPPGLVHGTTHNADSQAVQALAALVTAYNDAAGRSQTGTFAGDQIGVTLTPGVYHSGAAVSNTGILTLDAVNDANAVFIFQVDAAMGMAAAAEVRLINGAQASRVFWQVNGAATLGATAKFAGTIMAMGAISVGAGASINGRLLARNGAITLDSNDVYATPPVLTITGGATATTNDPTPTIAGATDVAVGRTITVTVAGQTLTTTVQTGGTWTVTAALIANGTYAVAASVTDVNGNSGTASQSLTIDTVLPVVTIVGGAAASTNDPTPTISGATDVGVGVTVTLTIAGQTLTTVVQSNGTWNVTPATVADGTNAAIASVTDAAGNVGSATQSLTVDTVAPTITISGGATTLTNDATPTISGTVTTDVLIGATVTATVAGQTLTTTVQSGRTWTVTAATITDGTHTVLASAADAAGNPGSGTQSLTVDTTAPLVTVTGGATVSTNDATPTITGTTNAATGTTVTVTIAGQTLTALVQSGGTWNVTPTTVADGTRTAIASVTDPAGNVGSATQSLIIDTIAPTITITGGSTALTNDNTPHLAGTTDVAVGAAVTVTIGGQTLTTTVQTGGTWTVTAAILVDGVRNAVASVVDAAGNAGSATQAVTIDTASPAVIISGGATASTNDSTPAIAGTASDVPAGTSVSVTVAGQTLTTTVQSGGTWTVTSASLPNAMYTVAVSVTDAAGNTGTSAQSLTIDTVLPMVTITGGATALTNDATPTIYGATDAPAGTTMTIGFAGQTLTALVQSGGTWNVTAATVADGTRNVVATVSDLVGNQGSATQSLTVDTSAPTVVVTGGSTALTNDATPTIGGTVPLDVSVGATVTVTVAGQTLTTTVQTGRTWTVTAASVADGTHTVIASVTDAAGNPGSGTQSLTIDTTAPILAITGSATQLTNDSTPTITGTTDAATGTTVTVTVAGQTLTALVQIGGTWNVTPTTVPDGTHAVVASVTDLAGSHGIATLALTVDTTPPTIAITGGATVLTNDATPTISGTTDAAPGTTVTVTIAGQTLTTTVQTGGTWTVTSASLVDGARNVVVTVADVTGNVRSATQSLTVDSNAPPQPSLDFTTIGPKRVFDTRPGQSPNALRSVAKQKVGGVDELEVQVTDLVGYVPAKGVGAVSLNVTVTDSEGDGFLTVYACGIRESVSSLNYTTGQTVANAIIAPVSPAGTVCIFSSAPTHIVADINGWFANGKAFTPVDPKRVFDTRPGQSPRALRTVNKARIQAGDVLEVRLTNLAGFVPTTGVGSVSLNVTTTEPSNAGFITVYDCGARELVSSLNYVADQTVANAVIAAVSPTGTVCFFSSATTDLVVDINGWLNAASGFTGVSPKRVLDTRAGQSPNAIRAVAKRKIGAAYVLEVQVTDLPGVVPATGVGGVSLNVVATSPEGNGYVTVYSCGTREEVSSLNYSTNQTVANAVLTPVSATGTICLYSHSPTDVIVDINGWFSNLPSMP